MFTQHNTSLQMVFTSVLKFPDSISLQGIANSPVVINKPYQKCTFPVIQQRLCLCFVCLLCFMCGFRFCKTKGKHKFRFVSTLK